jgi:hypothetical protein
MEDAGLCELKFMRSEAAKKQGERVNLNVAG